MTKSTRRAFLSVSGAASLFMTTGCLRLGGGNTDTETSGIKDTDGDGVIDSEDYAPRDPDVQREEQVVDNSSPTETDTETESPTETDTETESPTETDTETESPRVTVIDDFESGRLTPAWKAVNSSGRDGFTIQSGVSPQGEFALKGGNASTKDSVIVRNDFTIDSDGASISFYLKLGPVLTGYQRANQLFLMGPPRRDSNDGDREAVIMFDQKDRNNDPGSFTPSKGRITSKRLRSTQLVELKNINFSNSSVGEVVIGGTTYGRNISFIRGFSKISSIRIDEGHRANDTNVILDDIRYSSDPL